MTTAHDSSGPLRFTLNGREVEVDDAPPNRTLLQWLRWDQLLVGTKEGCAEGDCGACTVVVVDPDGPDGACLRAVNACLIPLPSLHGRHVLTVEGIGDERSPHAVQSAMTEMLGSQCGYCTPGIVMSLFEAHHRSDLDAGWKLDDQMAGNLCRCTGYRPIRAALDQVAGAASPSETQELLGRASATAAVDYAYNGDRFLAPTGLGELFSAMAAHPDHTFIAGATDLGLSITKQQQRWDTLISLERLAEIRGVRDQGNTVWIGAGTRLADVEQACAEPLPPITRMLRFFGARQIKHQGTVGGNLCNASPIGDLAPVLMALDARIELLSATGSRHVPLESFFMGYRRTALKPGEILASVTVPKLPDGARAGAYKVSKRRELDISTVSAAFVIEVDDQNTVTRATCAYGGMAATTKRATHVEQQLVGREWYEPTVAAAVSALDHDFAPISDHRGSAWYRREVAGNLLLGFFHETLDDPVRALPDHPTATVVLGGAS